MPQAAELMEVKKAATKDESIVTPAPATEVANQSTSAPSPGAGFHTIDSATPSTQEMDDQTTAWPDEYGPLNLEESVRDDIAKSGVAADIIDALLL